MTKRVQRLGLSLLVACAPHRAEGLLGTIRQAGYPRAALVGTVKAGNGVVEVTS